VRITTTRWVVAVAALSVLSLAGCRQAPTSETTKVEPATIEKIAGSSFSRITLTERAIERLGIETDGVRQTEIDGKRRKVVSYGAVLYEHTGKAYVYTNTEPRVFVRAPITIERIQELDANDGGVETVPPGKTEEVAILSKGPSAGVPVVTVGGPELFGVEFGIGE
jgi:hypothetical protein